MMDWADGEVSDARRDELFSIAEECDELVFMFLTKRGRNMYRYITKRYSDQPPKHFWFGLSWQHQKPAELDWLLNTPAAVRYLSAEPLLAPLPLELLSYKGQPTKAGLLLDQVIIGGESGRRRRDCGVGAIVGAAKLCLEAGVAPFVKQDSALLPGQQGRIPDEIWKLKQFPSVYQKQTYDT